MIRAVQGIDSIDAEAIRELRMLQALDEDPTVSQRALARDLGVAVGVVNSCMRALVRKGIVKVRGENNRTITYHLTHEGVVRKAALAVQWTANTLEFYRSARRQVADRIAELVEAGHRAAILYGANELAEIAVLVASATELRVVSVVAGADRPVADSILGVAVVSASEATSVDVRADVVILTEVASPERVGALVEAFPDATMCSLLGQLLTEEAL